MSTFLGIGFGPIQTGIFLAGAEGNFEKLLIAEVDNKIVDCVRANDGKVAINIATKNRVFTREIKDIEIFNPMDTEDLKKLIKAASDADEICTALPSVKFFPEISIWLSKAFALNPEKKRLLYTAENHNHAAEILAQNLKLSSPKISILNTVIGKMSCVLSSQDCKDRKLKPLTPDCPKGHLVEEFNSILISDSPDIEKRKISGLSVKRNLLPFEEAKLYGHNAVHLLLGLNAARKSLKLMSELAEYPEIISKGRRAFIDETGKALLLKWQKQKDFFTKKEFDEYAEDLLQRMLNPFLMDPVERVCRDLERKLGWDDRLVGAIRTAYAQNISSPELVQACIMAISTLFGTTKECEIRNGFKKIWPQSWTNEHKIILENIIFSLIIKE
jgi:mannitol-1-phosphate 5-dehydrogenase